MEPRLNVFRFHHFLIRLLRDRQRIRADIRADTRVRYSRTHWKHRRRSHVRTVPYRCRCERVIIQVNIQTHSTYRGHTRNSPIPANYYRTQSTAEGSVFGADTLWLLCLCRGLWTSLYREPLNGFAQNSHGRRVWSLSRKSLNVKVGGQRSRSPGTKTAFISPFGALRAVYVW